MQQLCCEEMEGKWLIYKYGGRQAKRVSLFPFGRQLFFLVDVSIHAAATSEDTVRNALNGYPLLFRHFLKCLHSPFHSVNVVDNEPHERRHKV
jgi:hypothetical protein